MPYPYIFKPLTADILEQGKKYYIAGNYWIHHFLDEGDGSGVLNPRAAGHPYTFVGLRTIKRRPYSTATRKKYPNLPKYPYGKETETFAYFRDFKGKLVRRELADGLHPAYFAYEEPYEESEEYKWQEYWRPFREAIRKNEEEKIKQSMAQMKDALQNENQGSSSSSSSSAAAGNGSAYQPYPMLPLSAILEESAETNTSNTTNKTESKEGGRRKTLRKRRGVSRV